MLEYKFIQLFAIIIISYRNFITWTKLNFPHYQSSQDEIIKHH